MVGAVKTSKQTNAHAPATALLTSHIPTQTVISVLTGSPAADARKMLLTMSVILVD